MTVSVIALFFGAYLVGSIPFGVLIGRAWRGIDIRQYGSGTIGFSNALRVLGWKPAAVVFVADALKGAVPVNLRPDLWGAIIAAVPFVDVLNTMSDTTLPLTPPEWPEWGNPLKDAAAYDYIASYSPYDNVAARPYPPILATGGLSDPRVTWWEPEKWIARLREHSTSGRPMLLKINMEAGHGGASGRFDFLKEIALDYAFAVWAIQGEAAAAEARA